MKCFCGEECVNGYCPNALDDMDRNSDNDAYSMYHLDKKISCMNCHYNTGCKDCMFDNTKMCKRRFDKTSKPKEIKTAFFITSKHNKATCSNCKRTFCDAYDFDNHDNYCRHCGAKIIGLKQEE